MPSTPTPADTAPRRLRADAERNRNRILAAAREVFAKRGLEVGLDDIARHAGVGVATVYRRFPDKSQLIDALFTDRFDQVLACLEEAAHRPDPWDGLAGALESLAEMQIEDRGLKDLLFSRFDTTDAFREHQRRFVPLLDDLLRRAKDAGVLRADVTITDLAVIQLMITEGAAFTAGSGTGLWRRYLTLLLDGLRADGAPPGSLTPPAMTTEEFDAALRRAGSADGRTRTSRG